MKRTLTPRPLRFLYIDPEINWHPIMLAVGWAGSQVFQLLLKVNGAYGLRGRLSAEFQGVEWLALMWAPSKNESAEDTAVVMSTLKRGLAALRSQPELVRWEEDGTMVLLDWEQWSGVPKEAR